MELKIIDEDFTVCQTTDFSEVDLNDQYCFIGKTDEENSVVCRTEKCPSNTINREDGWKAFKIQGVLDFSLIGILSKISTILAENKIGIYALSTYNTDYILTKKEYFELAINALDKAGYKIKN